MSANLTDALDKIEVKLRELKRDYELYFKGELRREPINDRTKLQNALNKLLGMHMANTSLKFRAATLSNSFQAACRYFDRITFQIETGTYKPDQFKADMRVGRFNPDSREVERPAFEPPKRPAGAPAGEDSAQDKRLRNLYQQFIEARRVTGEDTGVSFQAFKRSVDKSRPSLESKHGNKLRYKVVIEDNRAKLKGYSS